MHVLDEGARNGGREFDGLAGGSSPRLNSPNVSFINVDTWVGIEGVAPNNPPGDGTHPTDNGYTTMVGFETTAYAPFF
jgi:hypothetical protein